jgi:hypothetical protein
MSPFRWRDTAGWRLFVTIKGDVASGHALCWTDLRFTADETGPARSAAGGTLGRCPPAPPYESSPPKVVAEYAQ